MDLYEKQSYQNGRQSNEDTQDILEDRNHKLNSLEIIMLPASIFREKPPAVFQHHGYKLHPRKCCRYLCLLPEYHDCLRNRPRFYFRLKNTLSSTSHGLKLPSPSIQPIGCFVISTW